MATKVRLIECCLCGEQIQEDPIGSGWYEGHNPAPLSEKESDRCCTLCNTTKVIPARLKRIMR